MSQQTLQELLALANEAAEVASTNMSETSSGGERQLLAAGAYLGRFVEYLEFGKHAGEYQGKPTKAAPVIRIAFALFGTDASDPAKPYILRSFDMRLGNNEKSKTKLAFDRMNYKGTATHFAQLLGQAYLIHVKVVKAKTSGKERNEISYAELAPPIEPLSKQPYPVPEVSDDLYRLFLWDIPRIEAWDAMHIEGVTDEGKSKNYLQNMCFVAENFHGSALESLLKNNGVELTLPEPEPEAPAVPQAPADIPPVTGTVPDLPQVLAQATVAPATPQVPVQPTVPVVPTIPAIPVPGAM